MDKVQLTVSMEQAQTISIAVDLLARLSIGQMNRIAEMIAMQRIPMYLNQDGLPSAPPPSIEVCEKARGLMDELSRVLGYSGSGHSFGIGNALVPVSGRRAYEISKVLEKTLAEYRDPTPSFRGVNYDGLLVRCTEDEAPVAQMVDSRVILSQKEQKILSEEPVKINGKSRPRSRI